MSGLFGNWASRKRSFSIIAFLSGFSSGTIPGVVRPKI